MDPILTSAWLAVIILAFASYALTRLAFKARHIEWAIIAVALSAICILVAYWRINQDFVLAAAKLAYSVEHWRYVAYGTIGFVWLALFVLLDVIGTKQRRLH